MTIGNGTTSRWNGVCYIADFCPTTRRRRLAIMRGVSTLTRLMDIYPPDGHRVVLEQSGHVVVYPRGDERFAALLIPSELVGDPVGTVKQVYDIDIVIE